MTHPRTVLAALAAALAACVATGCGGGGGGSTVSGGSGGGNSPPPLASNQLSVVIDDGPVDTASSSSSTIGTINTPFVTVTLCAHGTSNCQTIDHISVDTGSNGLRVVSSVLSSSLASALTPVTDTQSHPLAECLPFADGYSWGSVKLADAKLGGEEVDGLSIQIIGDPALPTVPAACSQGGATEEDTVTTFGANGILGIGAFKQDCGTACVNQTTTPQLYYGCPTASTCTATTVALASQVWNPVALLPVDNNGTILELDSVASGNAATSGGLLIFGIDTQSNNALGTATVLTLDPTTGNLTVAFNGQNLSQSFIDSGSNAYFFNDSNLAACTSSGEKGFYCPPSSQALSATITSHTSIMSTVNFSIGDADTLFRSNNGANSVFSTLGGTNSVPQSFDFGLPFFLGRHVYTAVENATTSGGLGPFMAF
jgi:hypothetical protein